MQNPTRHPALDLDEITIKPLESIDATVEVLGSKSYTNRYLAIAGLSQEPTTLRNALLSQDTLLLSEALRALGHVDVTIDSEEHTIEVRPNGQTMRAPEGDIDMVNAGTPIRLLMTMASLAEGHTVLTGSTRMQERPMGHLLEALPDLGARATSVRGDGSPPIVVEGPSLTGGSTRVNGSVSSQFTTSLLISAPRAAKDTEVQVEGGLISKPYVDMTVEAMARTGVVVERQGYERFKISAGQAYTGGEITVEPDASGMSYFLAAAAILNGRVHIPGITPDSVQGDVGLVEALVEMGCRADAHDSGITLEGGELRGIEIDMSNMPDVAPTLAVVAAYAQGTTHITGIGNLRLKECDRIEAMCTELSKMGATVSSTEDSMTIEGGAALHGAGIDTYDDHRIAMCFAIAGLRTPGVVVRDPGCVTKSFPDFWDKIDGLSGDPR